MFPRTQTEGICFIAPKKLQENYLDFLKNEIPDQLRRQSGIFTNSKKFHSIGVRHLKISIQNFENIKFNLILSFDPIPENLKILNLSVKIFNSITCLGL